MTTNARAMGCLTLFALPFAAAGTFVGWMALSTVAEWAEVRAWSEVPARILATDLEVHSDSDGGSTYRVTATYEYRAFGDTYTSSRVTFSDWADNIGSFHQDKYRELSAYQRSGDTFRCFISPSEPSESILYRELRWGLVGLEVVFALVFAGVGYGLIFAAWYGKRVLDAEEVLKEAHPDQPWLWEQRWRDGRVRASSKAKMVFAGIFATFWNLVSTPVLFIVPSELEEGNWVILVALLFPTIGAGLLIWAATLAIRWRKFGASVFEMSRVPGVVGGLLEGRVVTNVKPIPDSFKATLNCERTRKSKDSSSTRILWQDVDEIDRGRLALGPTGTVVPVRFVIPNDAKETSTDSSSTEIDWRLVLESEVPGVDYQASFEVPVFRAPDSDPNIEEREAERRPRSADDVSGRRRRLLDVGIVLEQLPSGARRYTFRPARHKKEALIVTALFAVWSGCTWATIHFDAPWLFPIAFGFFWLILLFATLDMWLGMRRVDVSPAAITYSGGLLGLGPRRTLARGDIAELETARGSQTGNRLFYRIKAKTKDGKSHLLAKQLDDQRLARRLVEEFSAGAPL